jgi:hypothetical protein
MRMFYWTRLPIYILSSFIIIMLKRQIDIAKDIKAKEEQLFDA